MERPARPKRVSSTWFLAHRAAAAASLDAVLTLGVQSLDGLTATERREVVRRSGHWLPDDQARLRRRRRRGIGSGVGWEWLGIRSR